MTPRRFYNPQFDLFLPNIVDLKFRDQKDTMERPFFSLSKSKRMKPIEYDNDWRPSGTQTCSSGALRCSRT
jgi:hypothetical protein